MNQEPNNSDLRRVSDEIAGRLRTRGIRLDDDASPDDIVRLLDAIEDFERTVQLKGGDLMVDEPVGARRVAQPDNPAFVLPRRRDDESLASYIGRITQARDRAAGA